LVADVCGGKHDQIPEIALFDFYENTLSKTPTDIVKQFKLKNCYQELLTLRLQVRQAERISAERFSKRSLVAILLKENQIPARDRNNCLKSDVHNGRRSSRPFKGDASARHALQGGQIRETTEGDELKAIGRPDELSW
jgi:hypothetical protein